MRFQHLINKIKLLIVLLLNGRITVDKLLNLAANAHAYRRRSEISGRAPTVVLFDVSNRCNLHCPTCRRSAVDVVDLSGQNEKIVALGDMALDRYKSIVNTLHRDMLLATLYVSGEPLLNSDVEAMVAHTSQMGVASMISSNGMLLNEAIAEGLLDAGLDYLKVAMSGFTQEVYGLYHKGGILEKVLANLAGFERIRRKRGKRCLVVLDYILFEHNRHEVPQVRSFCRENGISFNLRYGRTLPGSELQSPVESREHYRPKAAPCDWLWKIMVFCHDGSAVPCCQFATCADSSLVIGSSGEFLIGSIWNGEQYRNLRRSHSLTGRKGMPLCENCFYSGVDFQS